MYEILMALLLEPQQPLFHRTRQLYDFMFNLGFFVLQPVYLLHII
jgi:hypothetical protein